MSYTAVVLAGSRPGGDPLAARFNQQIKALIPVAGKAMVRWPVEALLASPQIDHVIVVTQAPERLRGILPDDIQITLRASQATIADTIAQLIADRAAQFPLLVTTADHALLTPAMIAEFVTEAAGADLAIGVVAQRVMAARFPAAKRTWIGFKGGRYSGANLFVFGSDKVMLAVDQWRAVEQDRKKGWRVLAALGPALLLGAVLKLRTLDQSVAAVGRKLGLTIRAVQLSDALAAVDIDKPEDHALAEAMLK
ncbi:MAG: nucleotidyltransferase family protein [Sphingomicrobium sp.]